MYRKKIRTLALTAAGFLLAAFFLFTGRAYQLAYARVTPAAEPIPFQAEDSSLASAGRRIAGVVAADVQRILLLQQSEPEPIPEEKPVSLYYQQDGLWAKEYMKWGGQIATAGCGLCSVAVAYEKLTGEIITPDQLAPIMGRPRGAGLDEMRKFFHDRGIACSDHRDDQRLIIPFLKSGGVVIANVGNHYVSLIGVNEAGTEIEFRDSDIFSSGAGKMIDYIPNGAYRQTHLTEMLTPEQFHELTVQPVEKVTYRIEYFILVGGDQSIADLEERFT